MNALRYPSLALIGLLAAAGCGKSRAPETQTNLVTLPGGAADGSDVTVDGRWCVRCHGDATRAPLATDAAGVAFAPPVDLSGATSGAKVGAHQAHLRAGSLRGAGVDCSTCHVVPANADAHVPGVNLRALAATRLGAQPAYTPTFTAGTGGAAGSCASTYCHGKFPGGLAATVSWDAGAAAATCGSCHAIPPTVKTDGTTAHTSSTACGGCHDGYSNTAVNPATHVNGVVEAGGCTGCHGTAGRPNGNMAGVTYDPTQAAAPPVDTGGKSATTDVLVGFHQAHVNPDSTGVYKPIRCTECHPDNTAGGTHPNGGGARVEITWANATGANQGGVTPTNTAGNGTSVAITCANYCHGSSLGAGYVGSVTSWTWTGAIGGGATCGNCHADPPASSAHASLNSSSNCGVCHPGYSATTVNVAVHINGQLDGGGESAGGSSCGACHATIFDGMTGGVAKASKHTLGNVLGTNDSPTDSGATWSAPLATNVPAANRSCVNMCHGDHPHDLTSPLTATHENNAYADATNTATRGNGSASRVGVGGAGTVNRSSTDFDAAQANGGLCVSCHRFGVAAGAPTIGAATFAASAHDATSTSNGTTTYTWEYGLHSGSFARNCTKCHASSAEGNTPSSVATGSGASAVHFSDNTTLLAGKTNPGGTAAGFVCYNCHGSGGSPANGAQGDRSGVNIRTQVEKTANHPANADTRHDTAAEYTNAAFGNELGVSVGAGQRHASCLDCHAPHAAKGTTDPAPYSAGTLGIPTTAVACPTPPGGTICATVTGTGTAWTSAMVGWKLNVGAAWYTVVAFTSATSVNVYPIPAATVPAGTSYSMMQTYRATNVAGPALEGAWGVAFGGALAAWGTPGAGNFTKSPAAGMVAGTDLEATLCFKCHSAFYGTLPTTPSGAFTETDQAREFNTANPSFHPVLGTSSATVGNTGNVLPPFSRASTMSCTDCHESNSAADPNGPHGSSAAFLLKGPNTTWSSAVASVAATAWMPAGTFCLNCHANNSTRSRFTGHNRGEHSVACTACHVLIPHGAGHVGLLVSVATGGTPAGGVQVTDSAPYAVNPRLFIETYPANNTTGWGNTNCGCDSAPNPPGSGH